MSSYPPGCPSIVSRLIDSIISTTRALFHKNKWLRDHSRLDARIPAFSSWIIFFFVWNITLFIYLEIQFIYLFHEIPIFRKEFLYFRIHDMKLYA